MTPDNELYIEADAIGWLPKDGVPRDWITLFAAVSDSGVFEKVVIEFDRFEGASDIRRFAKDNGFEHRLDNYLHRTVCIDMDMDCFLVEWHLSFPSDKERIAWLLSKDWNAQLQGWH